MATANNMNTPLLSAPSEVRDMIWNPCIPKHIVAEPSVVIQSPEKLLANGPRDIVFLPRVGDSSPKSEDALSLSDSCVQVRQEVLEAVRSQTTLSIDIRMFNHPKIGMRTASKATYVDEGDPLLKQSTLLLNAVRQVEIVDTLEVGASTFTHPKLASLNFPSLLMFKIVEVCVAVDLRRGAPEFKAEVKLLTERPGCPFADVERISCSYVKQRIMEAIEEYTTTTRPSYTNLAEIYQVLCGIIQAIHDRDLRGFVRTEIGDWLCGLDPQNRMAIVKWSKHKTLGPNERLLWCEDEDCSCQSRKPKDPVDAEIL